MILDRTGQVWSRTWEGNKYSYDGETISRGEIYECFVIVGPPIERDAWDNDEELVHPCIHIFQAFSTYEQGEIARIAELRFADEAIQRLS